MNKEPTIKRKICLRCHREKASTEFNANKTRPDGLQAYCKICSKAYECEYGRNNKEKIRIKNKNYLKATKGSVAKRNTPKDKCRNALRDAVHRGKIIKPLFCEFCGKDKKIQGHHPDYTKPLEVDWACSQCHTIIEQYISRHNLVELQSKIQALGTELERQNKVIADEYKYRCGLVGKLQSVEAENKKLQEQEEMSNGCFIMIAEALEKVGCCHGHDAKSTPPMSYDDMIYCAVAKREKQIKTLQADLDKAKEVLEKYGEHSKKCYKNLTIGGFCDCGLEQALESEAQDEEGRAEE